MAAGSGAAALGASPIAACAIGAAATLSTIAAGRFAGLALRGRSARFALHLAHALPAAVVGYALAPGLARLAGLDSVGPILAAVSGVSANGTDLRL